jgi:indolepyruvate ferredoxin oxidoreductase beta subunit
MERNILIVGVGGQGILTIAQAISRVAMSKGLHVKQSEVHGMSQRGGAVQAHLRYADHRLDSDLIPLGHADLLLAVEPLEALRYTQYLRDDGWVIAGSTPFPNIPDYPPLENIYERIAQLGRHIIFDAQRLARIAGSAKSENIVILGAATFCLDFAQAEFESLIADVFRSKGERIIEINERALLFGTRAAQLFREGLQNGLPSRTVRKWMETLPAEAFTETESHDRHLASLVEHAVELPEHAASAIVDILTRATSTNRRQIFEHEIYRIIELAGATKPPRYRFVPRTEKITEQDLIPFEGERLVLKIVSQDIVHKTEEASVLFVTNEIDAVRGAAEKLVKEKIAAGKRVEGVLLVEYVPEARRGFGAELFVGIRHTREFGPVIGRAQAWIRYRGQLDLGVRSTCRAIANSKPGPFGNFGHATEYALRGSGRRCRLGRLHGKRAGFASLRLPWVNLASDPTQLDRGSYSS